MVKLKPYPAYKDSGVAWLGNVPAHWEVHRGKALFECIDVRSAAGDEELLTVSSERGVIPRRTAKVTMFKAESYVGYKLCWPGDLVINSLWAWARGLGVSRYHGIVSPAYGVYRPKPRVEAHPRFIHELVRSAPFHWELRVRSKGVWISRLQLTDEAFLGAPIPLPPYDEQAVIGRFLEHVDSRIRQITRVKQRQIILLNEQKQAIIQQAVTKGLDPTVPLKPSGVQWLGDVPEHWKLMKLVRVIRDGPRNGISPPIDETGTIESFSISAIRNGVVDVREGDKKYIAGNRSSFGDTYDLLRGDVLLVRGNGNIRLVGKAGLVEHDMPGSVYPDLLMRIRTTRECVPQFLVALLNCAIGRYQIEMAARTAVGTFKINNQQVRQLYFAFPPVAEQRKIMAWLTLELRATQDAVCRMDSEITLLHEYRNRLIADVVTGKLDVREAAANLPAELEPLEAEDLDIDEDSEDLDEESPEQEEA